MTGPARPDLDRLLAAWASHRRLPDAEAERIRQAIVPVAPPLQATWWTEFNDKLSTAIARPGHGHPGPRAGRLHLGGISASRRPGGGWPPRRRGCR